ncbi:MAG: response regulator [Gammaproteobacteria bacterium]|nr:response regulator [Gammaproteobacteria bacterium]
MNKNALIVDDSRLACKIMSSMLDSMDIDSVAVFSAEDALEYLKSNLPDIIFLDHNMPGMDGLEMIRLLKSNPDTATVPVLMYTAKQGDVYVSQARALGAVDVLPKGMEKNYLAKALVKLGFIKDTVLDSSSKQSQPEEVIKIQEKTTDLADPIIYNDGDWQNFWQNEIKPFLFKQRKRNTDDIKYTTRQQTLILKREIHQTLEQFEHILFGQIQKHQEIKNKKDAIQHEQSSKLFLGFAIFIILLQIAIFWQLSKGNQQNEQLLTSLKTQQQEIHQLDQQITQINQQMSNDQTTISNFQNTPEIVEDSIEIPRQSISLVDNFGEVVASDLMLINSELGGYQGSTVTGYQFIVSDDEQVGWPLDVQYFLSNDCSGNIFVKSENAKIYRGDKGEIWYVGKLAIAIEVAVNSQLKKNTECLPVEQEMMALKPLERDYQFETGIDSSLSFQLSFE